MYRLLVTLTLLLGFGIQLLHAQDGQIEGPQIMPTHGKAVFEFLNKGDQPDRNVHWSVTEVDGGIINANGWYQAPLQPGKYHIQCFSLSFPDGIRKKEIEIKYPSKIFQALEIYGIIDDGKVFLVSNYFHLHPEGIIERMERGHKHDLEGNLELVFKSGKSVLVPCLFWIYNKTSFERDTAWMSLIENPDLSEVNRIRLRKNGDPKVLLDDPISGDLMDQDWKMIQTGDGLFKFRPSEDWYGGDPVKGKRIKAYVSWDNGASWQIPIRGRENFGVNWDQIRLPLGGLLENPDPKIQFEITMGLNRKSRIYNLKEILKNSAAAAQPEKLPR